MDIEIRGMAPLIQVFDMPTSLAFYRDVLGFEVADTSPARGPNDFDWARLRQGDTELMLNTAYEHERRPPQDEPSDSGVYPDHRARSRRMWRAVRTAGRSTNGRLRGPDRADLCGVGRGLARRTGLYW